RQISSFLGFDLVKEVDARVFVFLEAGEVVYPADLEVGKFFPPDILVVLALVALLQVNLALGRIDGVEADLVGIVKGADVMPFPVEGRQAAGLERGENRCLARGLLFVDRLELSGEDGGERQNQSGT